MQKVDIQSIKSKIKSQFDQAFQKSTIPEKVD